MSKLNWEEMFDIILQQPIHQITVQAWHVSDLESNIWSSKLTWEEMFDIIL